MRKDWSKELERVTFRCGVCRHTWESVPDLVEPDPDAEHHPWAYFGNCPGCDAKHQPQAPWERALLKAHQLSTGPKSASGKAAAAANLDGHPTPEETLRTRFNGMKHGLTARTATYFPAKPGKYAFCANCDVDRWWCAEQPACVKQTEIFMLHHAAFEQRNPRMLGKLHGDLHAALVASLQMCLQAVLGDGAVLKVPKVQLDKDGRSVALTWTDEQGNVHHVMEYMANPAFKPIADLVTRLGLSLADLGMTVKAAEDEDEELRGRLQVPAHAAESLDAFAGRMAAMLDKVPGLLGAAAADAAKDPVLLEHQAATGAAAPVGAAVSARPAGGRR
jgi:hypothetical protein